MSESWKLVNTYKGWHIYKYTNYSYPKLRWRATFDGYQWNGVIIDTVLKASSLAKLKGVINRMEAVK